MKEPICAVWLGGTCFGLSVRIVGELALIPNVTEVPLAPREVLGIFSLRGEPLPVVDLAGALGFGATGPSSRVLVLSRGGLRFAIPADRVEMIPANRRVVPRPRSSSDHQAIEGFVELDDGARSLTLLSSDAIMEAVERLSRIYE